MPLWHVSEVAVSVVYVEVLERRHAKLENFQPASMPPECMGSQPEPQGSSSLGSRNEGRGRQA